jgi:hypothetical protein
VLGYDYWKKRFNADPGLVGKQVKLNGHPVTVIGIAPESFHGTYSLVDMQGYIPLGMRTLWRQTADKSEDPNEFWTKRDLHDLTLMGVYKPEQTRKSAEVSANIVAQQLNQQFPETHKSVSYRLYPEKIARPDPDPANGMVIVGALFMLLAGMVLLLACSNVANIVLVRATARERLTVYESMNDLSCEVTSLPPVASMLAGTTMAPDDDAVSVAVGVGVGLLPPPVPPPFSGLAVGVGVGVELAVGAVELGHLAAVAHGDAVALELRQEVVGHRLA